MRERRPIDPESLLEHARGVRELAVALCGDGNDADDVVQETWRVALERGAPPHASVGAWLAGIVRRLAHGVTRSETRRRDRERLVARDDRLASPDELAARAALHRELVEAVLALDEPSRSALLLRYFEGLKPAEIAAREHLELDTVKSRLSRGLVQLRRRTGLDREQRSHAWIAALGLTRHGVPVQPFAIGALMKLSTSLPVAAAALAVAAVCVWIARPDASESVASPEVAAAVASLPELDDPERVVGSRDTAAAPDLAAGTVPVAGESAFATPVVTGRVVDLDGRPIAGATVSAVIDRQRGGSSRAMWGSKFERTVVASVVASTDGSFQLDLEPGLRVDVEGSASGYSKSFVRSVEVGDDVHLELGGGCSLSGRVTRADDGSAVAGARVQAFRSPTDGLPDFEGTTDPTGRYELPDLSPGRMRLVVAAPDLVEEGFVIVELTRDELAVVDVVLDRGADLEVEVVDARDGMPIPGAQVHVHAGTPFRKSADEHGRLLLCGLRIDGWSNVSASADGYGSRKRIVDAAWTAIRIELEREHVASGTVFDPAGRPVEGAAIRVYGGEDGIGHDRLAAETAEDGSFLVRGLSPRARHVLWVGHPGYAERVIDFPPSELERETTTFGSITLSKPSSLRGRVVDSEGHPLADARLVLNGWNSDRSALALENVPGFEHWIGSRTVRSDADGVFQFVDLAQGPYWLTAQTRAGRVDRELWIRAEAEQEVELVCEPSARLSGRVVDEAGRPVQEVNVVVFSEPYDGTVLAQWDTDASGSFDIGGLPQDATFTVAVCDIVGRDIRRPALASRRFQGIAPSKGGLVLTLPLATSVEGRVLGADDRPLSGCSVFVDMHDGWMGMTPRAATDRDGRFRLLVEPGVPVDLQASLQRAGEARLAEQGTLANVVPPASGLVIRMRRN